MGFMPDFQIGGSFNGDRSNSVRLEGADELITRLFAIPDNVGRKYLKQAVAAAMKPMKAQLRANTPQGPTGNLRAAVAHKVKLYETGTAFGIVGYQRAVSRRTNDNKGFHSHFVEFGTKERRPKRGPFLSSYKIKDWRPGGWRGQWPFIVKFVRPARARHPMESAYRATAAQCAGILETEMARALERATGGGA